MIVITLITNIGKAFMNCQEIERLKKDRNEILHYRKNLLKKGKETLAYKMQRKAEYIDETIRYMRAAGG
jgi:uncharacterized protein YoxC